jgi:hypothetical protein
MEWKSCHTSLVHKNWRNCLVREEKVNNDDSFLRFEETNREFVEPILFKLIVSIY